MILIFETGSYAFLRSSCGPKHLSSPWEFVMQQAYEANSGCKCSTIDWLVDAKSNSKLLFGQQRAFPNRFTSWQYILININA